MRQTCGHAIQPSTTLGKSAAGGRPVVAAGGSPRSASPQETKPARYSRFDEPINQRPGGRPNAAPTVPRTIRYQQMDTHSPPIPRDPNIGWIIRDTKRFGANRDNSKPANNSGTPIFHPREVRTLDVSICPFVRDDSLTVHSPASSGLSELMGLVTPRCTPCVASLRTPFAWGHWQTPAFSGLICIWRSSLSAGALVSGELHFRRAHLHLKIFTSSELIYT